VTPTLVNAQVALTNDDFADALDISDDGLSYQFFPTGGTAESGEPPHAGTAASNSLWFKLSKPEDGVFRINDHGGSSNRRIAVYTGEQLDQLVSVAEGTDEVYFQTEANVQYSIAVDSDGYKLIDLYQYANGGGDEWSDADVLPSTLPLRIHGNNIFATAAPTDEALSPYEAPSKTVWWKWTAPASGHIKLDPTSSTPAIFLRIYEQVGNGELTQISNNTVTAGNHYYFYFDERDSGPGEIDCWLEWIPAGAPANDDIVNAIDLGNEPVVITGAWMFHATGQDTLPDEFIWQRTAWWRWTCPESGDYILSALGTYGMNDTSIATFTIFTGTHSNLTQLASSDQSFSFAATAGVEYYIRLHSYHAYINLSMYPGTGTAPYFEELAKMDYRQPSRPKLRGADRHPFRDPDGDGFNNLVELVCGAYPSLNRPEDASRLPHLDMSTGAPLLRWRTNSIAESWVTFEGQTTESLDTPWQSTTPAPFTTDHWVHLPTGTGKGFGRLSVQDPRFPGNE